MKVFDKIKWVLGILLVFIIVLTTNLIDKGNFNRIRYSIVTIYEDRIVANDLIFEISTLVQEKEMAFTLSDSTFVKERNADINNAIQNFIEKYEQTKITNEEREVFTSLKNNLSALQASEKELVSSGFQEKGDLSNSIKNVKADLYDLSKIQLKEGKRQMSLSEKTMDSIELFTQVEIIFLVVMAVLIQVIILYKPA